MSNMVLKREFFYLCWSREMENLWFVMFDKKTELVEKRGNDAITTKKVYIWFFITLLLRNKKTSSTNKRNKTEIGIEIFLVFFFKYMKNRGNIKS